MGTVPKRAEVGARNGGKKATRSFHGAGGGAGNDIRRSPRPIAATSSLPARPRGHPLTPVPCDRPSTGLVSHPPGLAPEPPGSLLWVWGPSHLLLFGAVSVGCETCPWSREGRLSSRGLDSPGSRGSGPQSRRSPRTHPCRQDGRSQRKHLGARGKPRKKMQLPKLRKPGVGGLKVCSLQILEIPKDAECGGEVFLLPA